MFWAKRRNSKSLHWAGLAGRYRGFSSDRIRRKRPMLVPLDLDAEGNWHVRGFIDISRTYGPAGAVCTEPNLLLFAYCDQEAPKGSGATRPPQLIGAACFQ